MRRKFPIKLETLSPTNLKTLPSTCDEETWKKKFLSYELSIKNLSFSKFSNFFAQRPVISTVPPAPFTRSMFWPESGVNRLQTQVLQVVHHGGTSAVQLRLSCRHDRFSFVINKRSAAFRINERGMKEGGRTFDWNCTKVPRHTQCFDSHILISTHTPTFELSVENEKILHFSLFISGSGDSLVGFFFFGF